MPNYLRVVFCAPQPVLADAFDRLAAFCARHRAPVAVWFAGYHTAVSVGRLDAATGALTIDAAASSAALVHPAANPSYLAFEPLSGLVAGVSETTDGGVTLAAFPAPGAPLPGGAWGSSVSQAPSAGHDPCHIAFSPCGGWVLVANYSCDAVSVHRVQRSAASGEVRLVPHGVEHAGEHPHQVVFTPRAAGKWGVYIPCLGTNTVRHYDWDGSSGKLTSAAAAPAISLPAGTGPRHVAVTATGGSPDGGIFAATTRLYVLGELNCTLAAFTIDPTTGAPVAGAPPTVVSTLPSDAPFRAGWSGAHIVAFPHPTLAGADIVLASNRGHDSLAAFTATVSTDGRVTLAAEAWVAGLPRPRDFAVHPGGRWVVVACQDSAEAVVVEVSPAAASGGGSAATAAAGGAGSGAVALVERSRVSLPAGSKPCFVGFR
jgi:6-phosphogluconolactonase